MVYLHFLSFIKMLSKMINDYQYSNLFKLKAFALTKGKVRSVSFTVMPLYTVLYIQLMKPKQLISSNTL